MTTATSVRTTRRTTPRGRITALGRAELTLLLRNRTALATALLLPVAMVAAFAPSISKIIPGEGRESANQLAMSGGIGFVLLFVVYYNLVTAYVARREELVLKRLRTGEPSDLEILVGTALPAVAVALLQILALLLGGFALLHLGLPHRPDLLILGVLLGIVLLAALAAGSTAFTRSVEIAQLTTSPLLLLSLAGSGLVVPLDLLPAGLAEACRWLPLSPVLELIRAGWFGGADAGTVLRALGTALAWTALAVFAVHRWFRWEPRR